MNCPSSAIYLLYEFKTDKLVSTVMIIIQDHHYFALDSIFCLVRFYFFSFVILLSSQMNVFELTNVLFCFL